MVDRLNPWEFLAKCGFKMHGEYINVHEVMTFECSSHHKWDSSVRNLMRTKTCPECRRRDFLASMQEYASSRGYLVDVSAYKHSRNKIPVVCPKGHRYSIGWASFKNGSSCLRCNSESYMIREETVRDRLQDLGFRMLGPYRGSQQKILVECHRGHEFSTTWRGIQRENPCNSCKQLQFFEKFSDKARQKGFIVLMRQKGARNRVSLICPLGHVITKNYELGSLEKGCQICSTSHRKGIEVVIRTLSRLGYKLVSGAYSNNVSPFTVKCDQNHLFVTTWKNLQQDHKCPECFGGRKYTIESVREIIASYGYTCLSDEYHRFAEKLHMKCPQGHEFRMRFSNFMQGSRCPHDGTNRPEKEISDFIESLGIKVLTRTKSVIPKRELDIYLPDLKLAIEHSGVYWHSEVFMEKNYHREKRELCEEQGIRLINIYGDEWKSKREIVESMIRHAVGKTDRKVYSRQCTVREISSQDATVFYTKNHIMGPSYCRNIGLIHAGEIVSCLGYKVFGGHIELIRFCCALNTRVVGSFSKLLAQLPTSPKVISYVDLRYGTGKSYEKLGFTRTGTTLGWKWTDCTNTYNRLRCRANMDSRGLTESEHASELGWYKIFDAGQAKYERMRCQLRYPSA